MICPELLRSLFDKSIGVELVKYWLEFEGVGLYWDEPIFVQLTDQLPDSASLPFGRLVFNVLSWADSSPGILGDFPGGWAHRFLSRLAYIHFEGDEYIEPSEDPCDYPLDCPLDFHGYPVE